MRKYKWLCLLMVMMLLVVVCFSSCSSSDEELTPIQTGAPTEIQKVTDETTNPMPIYTDEEIQSAVDVVEEKFNEDFQGCQLLRLEYPEDKYQSDCEYYANRCGVDRVIVLESDYYAGSDAPPSLNQNHAYHNWKWILIDDGSGWTVWTSGYG